MSYLAQPVGRCPSQLASSQASAGSQPAQASPAQPTWPAQPSQLAQPVQPSPARSALLASPAWPVSQPDSPPARQPGSCASQPSQQQVVASSPNQFPAFPDPYCHFLSISYPLPILLPILLPIYFSSITYPFSLLEKQGTNAFLYLNQKTDRS